MENNVPLGLDVLVHIFVHVQMVWRKISNHSDVRAFAHRNQLKTREFHNGNVVFADVFNDGQQRRTDVSAQMNSLAVLL